MAEGSGWCTIESDPGVFTELLRSIGVAGLQVEELYALDAEAIRALSPHGLVFLFHYGGASGARNGDLVTPTPHPVFFARQMITNACATQAILSIVLNATTVDSGPILSNLRQFCTGMDATTIGLAISNSPQIRDAHNSFAPPTHFSIDEETQEKEDAFHFVSYVPVNGRVYELDGLQAGPRDHGPIADSWVDVAVQALSERVGTFAASEIRFNLMAITDDIADKLNVRINNTNGVAQAQAREALSVELARRERWRVENIRRRTNFLPFIVETLKFAAKSEVLDEAVKKAAEQRAKAVAEMKQSDKAKQKS